LLRQDQMADRGDISGDDDGSGDTGGNSDADKNESTQPLSSKSKKKRRCGRPNPKRIPTGSPEDSPAAG
jgi:hypothetical protein